MFQNGNGIKGSTMKSTPQPHLSVFSAFGFPYQVVNDTSFSCFPSNGLYNKEIHGICVYARASNVFSMHLNNMDGRKLYYSASRFFCCWKSSVIYLF